MSKTREQKQQMIDDLAGKFGKMKSAVFTAVSGYTMEDADALRRKGRDQGVELMVTKKTLLLRALKDVGIEVDEHILEGSILTAVGLRDEVAPAKLIHEFFKDRESVRMVGGILEGKSVDASSVIQLAKLPSKQELLAKVVGSLNAPVSGFVRVLSGNLRGFLYALQAIKDQKIS
ncbi:TPA: 50S ribosomal protein L10 [Candidatus Uhrbacteria bacterium]|uniref:Large ribosomal subunit protein uL10 n=2 Tax=Candidatus Uhriibacteriota TaxID=1752732 RepID=A0A0G1Q808_9BACT|nr:MAG: 50S ribosomal protein L10 [Candidatus Uhrbacteria bacterium GW2011_GWF2_46_218]KKU41119.1 MAG: 50S ribosomal protein L10 [Candidatus Uhrbacteria bacterium GW2011_GWE2_46_68]HBK34300.1 50S ribosomal protein L10 [Candidatus Uhrbacteria bacterium]HCB19213.1 50S ribosomal protein L10 [Candidatus Uhrbacteria bacterium]